MSGYRDFDSFVVESVHFDPDYWADSAYYNDSTSPINIVMYQTMKMNKAGEIRESENSEYTLFVQGSDVGEPSIGDTLQYTTDSSSSIYYTITSLVGNHGNVFECKTVKQTPKSGNNSRNLRNIMDV